MYFTVVLRTTTLKIQPNGENKCWHCMFLQTGYVICVWRYVADMLRFNNAVVHAVMYRFKKDTVMVRKKKENHILA